MDPTTTLYAFRLQTHPSVQSVQLLGSWDNFSILHNMERDIRRDQSEWRGLHKFNKIVADGDRATGPERRAGLKQGQIYYYYYEVDGSTETYNPSQPTTTTCPFLPGQTVNTLEMPVERRLRMKSASMNSLRSSDYKTMNPADRFVTPRPQAKPQTPAGRDCRIASSSSSTLSKRSARSVSPASGWTGTARRLLGLKSQQDSDRGRKCSARDESRGTSVDDKKSQPETRSTTPSGSIRSRDMSPESLRRFLSEDLPSSTPAADSTPVLAIPDDIAEENEDNDDDDDDNFAMSPTAINSNVPFGNLPFTTLSPPPFMGGLSAPPPRHAKYALGAKPPMTSGHRPPVSPFSLDVPKSRGPVSAASSTLPSPTSPVSNISRAMSQFSFFDDSDDDEANLISPPEDETLSTGPRPNHNDNSKLETESPITSYGLPQTLTDRKRLNSEPIVAPAMESSPLAADNDATMSVGSTGLFSLPNVDIGMDDLMGDMNWMSDVMRPKLI
ncbi:hypothetical protein F5Y18DRAFT_92879 [Xylariaceae sp. FL1019]|nr:hypothetical protein F5Y18DRAFT_92879 [Xylariaceae sp. FL1019]